MNIPSVGAADRSNRSGGPVSDLSGAGAGAITNQWAASGWFRTTDHAETRFQNGLCVRAHGRYGQPQWSGTPRRPIYKRDSAGERHTHPPAFTSVSSSLLQQVSRYRRLEVGSSWAGRYSTDTLSRYRYATACFSRLRLDFRWPLITGWLISTDIISRSDTRPIKRLIWVRPGLELGKSPSFFFWEGAVLSATLQFGPCNTFGSNVIHL